MSSGWGLVGALAQERGAVRLARRPPQRKRDQTRFEHVEIAEESEDLLACPPPSGAQILVEQLLSAGGSLGLLRVLLPGVKKVGDGHVAAMRQLSAEASGDAGRVLVVVVVEVVQDGQEQQADRLAEIDELTYRRAADDASAGGYRPGRPSYEG